MDQAFWIAVGLGASLVGSLSALVSYSQQKESPKVKSVIRDALIGAAFVAVLWQLVPDSMSSVVSSLPSVDSVFKAVSGGAADVPDFELQTGPARF